MASIWKHGDCLRNLRHLDGRLNVSACPHCKTTLTDLKSSDDWSNHPKSVMSNFDRRQLTVAACLVCGWWKMQSTDTSSNSSYINTTHYAAIAVLKNLDLMDLTSPIAEIQSFLTAKYQVRFDVHPRLFEETAASVLVPEGFSSRVTAYTRDGGIDAVFDGPQGQLIGVQVKRYSSNIGVECIREFAGALLIGGHTQGIFVTTSRFTSDAKAAAEAATERGHRVELIDADRFYDALKLTQTRRYEDKEDLLSSIGEPTLQRVGGSSVYKPARA